jgi:hypothetical protein
VFFDNVLTMDGVDSESSKKKRKTQVGRNSFDTKAQPIRGQTLEDWAFTFVCDATRLAAAEQRRKQRVVVVITCGFSETRASD